MHTTHIFLEVDVHGKILSWWHQSRSINDNSLTLASWAPLEGQAHVHRQKMSEAFAGLSLQETIQFLKVLLGTLDERCSSGGKCIWRDCLLLTLVHSACSSVSKHGMDRICTAMMLHSHACIASGKSVTCCKITVPQARWLRASRTAHASSCWRACTLNDRFVQETTAHAVARRCAPPSCNEYAKNRRKSYSLIR